MTPTLSPVPAARSRWRSIFATFALVGALVASTSAMSATADVVGAGPGTVSGTVTTSDGQPIEGAGVNVSVALGQGTPFSAYTTTDSSGHYEFAGLDLNAYYVSTYVSGYQQQPGQNATLTDASLTATIAFVLVPYPVGNGTLSGHVTADGVPLANQSVTAYSGPTGQNIVGETDDSGYFQFTDLGYGPWTVTSWAGPQYQYLSGAAVQLTESAPAATYDLAFQSWPVGTASIVGVLTDSLTGEAIPGIGIALIGLDVANNSTATSDETGAYSFDLLPEGNYYLSIWAPGYVSVSIESVHAASDQPVTLNFALVATNSTISGHIVGPDGNPAVGVGVSAFTPGSSSWASTDANGDYVITDVAGIEYTVRVGGEGTPYKLKDKTVTPPANGNAKANFKLKDRKTGTLGGILLGPDGNWYPQPVCVTLYSSKNKNPIDEVATYGPDFGDGTYSFFNLKPGSYTVSFADCDDDPIVKFDTVFLGGAKKYKDAAFVTIVAGEDNFDSSFTLTYKTPTSTISGHIAKTNGTAIAGLAVHATNGISSVDAVTNANGDYTISGLYGADYTVSVGGAGTLYVHKEKSVTAIEGSTVTANFSLAKK